MGQGLEPKQELKIENSRQLNNVALVLLPVIVGVVGFTLQFRVVGPGFWWLSGGASVVLAASIYSGGLGISRLRRAKSSKFSLFNTQAVLVVAGFLLLLSTYFALGDEKATDIQKRLNEISREIGIITERIKTMKAQSSDYEKQIQKDFLSLSSRLTKSEHKNKLHFVNVSNQLATIEAQIGQIKDLVKQPETKGNQIQGQLPNKAN